MFSLFLSLGIIPWFCKYFFCILSSRLRIKTQIWLGIFSSSHFYRFFSITLFFAKGKLEWSKLTSCFVCFNLMAMFSSNQIRWFRIICNGGDVCGHRVIARNWKFCLWPALFCFLSFQFSFLFLLFFYSLFILFLGRVLFLQVFLWVLNFN